MKKLISSIAAIVLASNIGLCCSSQQQYAVDNKLNGSEEMVRYDVNDNQITHGTLDDIINSSVQVQGLLGQGSGTVLYDSDEDEYFVLTADHVVRYRLGMVEGMLIVPSTDYLIKDINSKEYSAELISFDYQNDLALLRLREDFPNPFLYNVSNGADVGDYVILSGYPGVGNSLILEDGRLSGIEGENGRYWRMVSASVNPGHSGGGAFVFNNGEPNLAGVNQVRMTTRESVGGIAREESLRRFLSGTCLKNDYL